MIEVGFVGTPLWNSLVVTLVSQRKRHLPLGKGGRQSFAVTPPSREALGIQRLGLSAHRKEMGVGSDHPPIGWWACRAYQRVCSCSCASFDGWRIPDCSRRERSKSGTAKPYEGLALSVCVSFGGWRSLVATKIRDYTQHTPKSFPCVLGEAVFSKTQRRRIPS